VLLKRTLAIAVVLACGTAGLLSFLTLRHCRENAYYKNRVARLERTLRDWSSIPCIQAWLANPDSHKHEDWWPECIRQLGPTQVRFIESGGVQLMWYQGDALGVDIYPAGKRPTRHPQVRDDYYGYYEPYGEDAYVWMTFK
jgi:hypothetical protein